MGSSGEEKNPASESPKGKSKRPKAAGEPFLWLLPAGLRRVVEKDGRGCLLLLALPVFVGAGALACRLFWMT